MRLKDGVLSYREHAGRIHTVRKPILYAQYLIADIMEASGEYCITSLLDGTHGPNSLHYVGLAMDIRIRHLKDPELVTPLAVRIQQELGGMYQVIAEKDHIHIETSDKWLAANGDPRKAV
jgi:hypothetical protein